MEDNHRYSKENILIGFAERIEEEVKRQGMKVLGKRRLDYGLQVVIEDETYCVLRLNIYHSKKGITYVPSDKKSGIFARILPLISANEDIQKISRICYAGSDESGKGDYFGPLAVAGMVSDESTDRELQAMGIKDSKRLSDARVLELAEELMGRFPSRIRIMSFEPEKYNTLYSRCLVNGKKLNSLLGYAHGNVISSLIKNFSEVELVIADQFGDESYITDEISDAGGRTISIIPRAEAYLAVAAGSILARSIVLKWNNETSRLLGIHIPKGCGQDVITCAAELVGKLGAERLKEYVKIHFKTTDSVMARQLK